MLCGLRRLTWRLCAPSGSRALEQGALGLGISRLRNSVCPHADSECVDQAGLELTEIHLPPQPLLLLG